MAESGDPEPGALEAAGTLGRVLAGRFRIERVLGRGGMGEVLLAHDTLLGRKVALKRLRTDGIRDAADSRLAALKEARRASQVSDRRIAAIHDVLELDDELILVMEYVDGETLRKQLAAPMALDRFWDLSRQCLEALEAAHSHGVIHRDIKPENLMLTRDREIKILDFGIAWRAPLPEGQVADGASTATTEWNRGPAGTPAYMAPEAHYGGRIDERTDLFSLGVVFYEMLTARHPFGGGAYEQVLDRIMNTTPPAVSELNAAVTPELSSVVSRMLARDPAQRFASCADVRAAMNIARRDSGTAFTSDETVPVLPGVRSSRFTGRAGWTLAGVAIAVLAVVAWRAFAPPPLPAERRLAVLAPNTPGADEEVRATAVGSTELLANRLARLQNWHGFQMSTFAESYDVQPVTAAEARRELGTNLALVPAIEQHDGLLIAHLELRSPSRERVLARRTIQVPVAEPFLFADSLYHSALSMLRLPRREQTAQADVGIRGAGTLRFLLRGMGRRRAAKTTEDRMRALADFETAYRTEPDPAAPRAWLAWGQISLFSTTKDTVWIARAEASAREAVALDTSRSESHRALAYVLGNRKRYEEALEHYRIACSLDPTDDDCWYAWGRMWMRLGRPDEERKVYTTAMSLRPHCFKPRWWLASWEYHNGHVPEAIARFREMVQRAPDYFNGYANLGGLLLFQGAYKAAIDTLHAAIALRPDATTFSNLGTAYFNLGQLNQAVDAFNQAFQFDDADYEVWLNLGDAYYWLRGRPDLARDAYRQGVRLGRDEQVARAQRGASPDPMIAAHLANAMPKLAETESAKVMLRQALALDSLNSRVQYQAALTEWQLGQREVALDWLQKAVANGFPVAWVRDSPVHHDWRSESRFLALLTKATPARDPQSPRRGESR